MWSLARSGVGGTLKRDGWQDVQLLQRGVKPTEVERRLKVTRTSTRSEKLSSWMNHIRCWRGGAHP